MSPAFTVIPVPAPIASDTAPDVPPPVRPLPAVTPVMSPIAACRCEKSTFFRSPAELYHIRRNSSSDAGCAAKSVCDVILSA